MARIRVAETNEWTESLKGLLAGHGHQLTDDHPDVEFVDVSLPLASDRDVLTLVVTPLDQLAQAIERCRAGAYAFVRYPFIAEEVELLLERAVDHQTLAHENHALRQQQQQQQATDPLEAAPAGAAASGDTLAVARNLAGKPLADIEKQVILSTLEQFKGHRVRTATALGIGVRTLGMKLKRWREEGEPIVSRSIGGGSSSPQRAAAGAGMGSHVHAHAPVHASS